MAETPQIDDNLAGTVLAPMNGKSRILYIGAGLYEKNSNHGDDGLIRVHPHLG